LGFAEPFHPVAFSLVGGDPRFPVAVVPEPGGVVEGQLEADLPPLAISRLDLDLDLLMPPVAPAIFGGYVDRVVVPYVRSDDGLVIVVPAVYRHLGSLKPAAPYTEAGRGYGL
jgi:hypothetical protein